MKNKVKCITLITLVIAIIILLVLSGITIKNITEKNGLFSKAFGEQEQNIQEEHKIDTVYVVNSISENNIYITIMIESNDEIEQVQTPDDNIINVNKNKLAIDYNVESGNEYTFKIKRKSDDDFKNYVLKANVDAKPVISQNESSIYPILTSYGIKLNKKVTIDYGEETNNYYSIDNGNTWITYEGEFVVEKECTILAKSIKQQEITKLDKEAIKMNLAPDALGLAAYDGNDNTSVGGYRNTYYIEIEPSMIGKKVQVYEHVESFDLYICDENKQSIQRISIYGWSSNRQTFTIPENAKFLMFYNVTVNEVRLINEPSLNIVKYYPKITPTGIQQSFSSITINYFDTSETKLYSTDDKTTWNEYHDGDTISLDLGKTIYAKGIDRYGVESTMSTYTAVLPSDALGVAAYDGNDNTYFNVNDNLYIEIDPSMIGKNVQVSEKQESFALYICNSSKQTIQTITKYGWSNGTQTFKIPENAKFLKFNYGKRVYEIRPIT